MHAYPNFLFNECPNWFASVEVPVIGFNGRILIKFQLVGKILIYKYGKI